MSGAQVTFTGVGGGGRSSTLTGADGSYALSLSRATLVSMSSAAETPSDHALFQNYPNPFNPETIIPYQISRATDVRLDIYNAVGQHIRTLVNGPRAPGLYRVRWTADDDRGRGVAAGVYIYRLETGAFSRSGKMVLVDGSHRLTGTGGSQLSRIGAANPPASKTLAAAPFYTITVTGDDFFDYERTGVAVNEDTQIDILVNSSTDQGMVRLGLTDAPVDDADAVLVTITAVDIRRASGGGWETFVGESRTIDLLSLTGGVSSMLGEQVLEPGEFTGVRLIVESAQIVIGGETFDLEVPSGEQSGIKLKGDFEIVIGETLDLMLDFDARRSIVRRGRGDDFLLKPVIRLLTTTAAGFIAGQVIVDGLPDGDIKAVVIATQDGEEVSSAKVDPEDGTYRISFLLPGTYDLHVEAGENLVLDQASIDGITVVEGEGTSGIDFTATWTGASDDGNDDADNGEESESEEGDEGVALSLDNAADAWSAALSVLTRIVSEVGDAGDAVVDGEVEGDAEVSMSVGLSGIEYVITLNAISDDGVLRISGEIVIQTSDGETFDYEGVFTYDGVLVGEMAIDMSGTIDDNSGTLIVGDEELIIE